jgi:hypothetical protein
MDKSSNNGSDKKRRYSLLIIGLSIALVLIATLFILLRIHCAVPSYDSYLLFGLFYPFIQIDSALAVIGLACIATLIILIRKNGGAVSISCCKPVHIPTPKIRFRHYHVSWRIWVSILIVAALAGSGYGIYRRKVSIRQAQEQEAQQKQKEEDLYLQYANTFKYDATVISNMTKMILGDYHTNWVNAIWRNTATDASGRKRNCSKFQTAVDWRITYFTNKGCMHILDSLENDMSMAYVKMDGIKYVPKKYASLKESYKGMRGQVSGLVELCKSPSGNVTEFGNTINEMGTGLSAALKETDIYIDNQELNANRYILDLFNYDYQSQ